MKKSDLSILLILMMLITPIASAFDHCAGMDMSGHLSDNHLSSVTLSTDDAMHLGHKKMLTGVVQNDQVDMDCHTSGSCTIHVCGGYGMTSSAPTLNTVSSPYYSFFEYTSPYNTVLPSELRPPIVIL